MDKNIADSHGKIVPDRGRERELKVGKGTGAVCVGVSVSGVQKLHVTWE